MNCYTLPTIENAPKRVYLLCANTCNRQKEAEQTPKGNILISYLASL